MSCVRFCLLPILSGSIFLLTGALSSPSSPSLSPAPPAPADPAAAQMLDRALERLAGQRLDWVEMNLWQQVNVQELCYQAEGRYLAGPDHRFRLDLHTHVGSTDGRLQVVSDGATLWQSRRIGAGPASVSKIDLKEVLAILNRPGTPPQLRDEFFHSQFQLGILPLLRGLRQQVTWSKKETVRRNGRVLLKLSGAWSADPTHANALLAAPWPAGLPRQGRLYLDPQTLWPHRVEWWGPDPPQAEDAPLVQMEFRDPVLNRPLSPERCAVEFTLSDGPAGAIDQTREAITRLQIRAQELTRKSVP